MKICNKCQKHVRKPVIVNHTYYHINHAPIKITVRTPATKAVLDNFFGVNQ